MSWRRGDQCLSFLIVYNSFFLCHFWTVNSKFEAVELWANYFNVFYIWWVGKKWLDVQEAFLTEFLCLLNVWSYVRLSSISRLIFTWKYIPKLVIKKNEINFDVFFILVYFLCFSQVFDGGSVAFRSTKTNKATSFSLSSRLRAFNTFYLFVT